jgi:lipoyl(octanoyl) transferase
MEMQVRHLGQQSYESVWHDMQCFTEQRDKDTDDEIWIVQHPSVFTLGKSGKTEHLLNTADIPVVQVDRGGQVTYHGPGQLVVYVLLDLKRLKLGIRELVTRLETSVINLLSEYGITAESKKEAPGVYVNGKKIAALGLRVRKGYCFHGLALNVDMDLEPFARINPCGYEGLEITQLSDFINDINFDIITQQLLDQLKQQIQNSE